MFWSQVLICNSFLNTKLDYFPEFLCRVLLSQGHIVKISFSIVFNENGCGHMKRQQHVFSEHSNVCVQLLGTHEFERLSDICWSPRCRNWRRSWFWPCLSDRETILYKQGGYQEQQVVTHKQNVLLVVTQIILQYKTPLLCNMFC